VSGAHSANLRRRALLRQRDYVTTMFKQVSDLAGGVAKSVTDSVSGAAEAIGGGAPKPQGDLEAGAKSAEREARSAAAQAEDAMAPLKANLDVAATKAKEYYGVAAEFVETQVSPRVSMVSAEVASKAKEYGEADVQQMNSEGVLTKEAVMEAYEATSAKVYALDGSFVLNTVVGDVPFMDKIPNANIAPADAKDAFVFWNAVCMALGAVDVAIFALLHFGMDMGRDFFLYLPMYILKLALDWVVCVMLAYGLYFAFVKSSASRAQQVGYAFLGLYALKSLLLFYFTFNLLALCEGVANSFLLLRAYMLTKAREAGKYTALQEQVEGKSSDFPEPPAAPVDVAE